MSKEKQSPVKRFYRYMIQGFVWFLIIAFVTTVGAGLDFASTPVIAKSRKFKVDLLPNSLFMVERERERTRIMEFVRENNIDVDPRTLESQINNSALSNTEVLLAHKEWFHDIGLEPSGQSINAALGRGYAKDSIVTEYGRQIVFGAVGVLASIVPPTLADAYAFRDLQNFSLAAEIISFNKTNFLLGKITPEQQEKYFNDNISQWAKNVTVAEFVFEKRSDARRFSQELKTKGLDVTNLLGTEYQAEFNNDTIVTYNDSSANYFTEILTAFQQREGDGAVVAGPSYVAGNYKVALLLSDISYQDLNMQDQITFLREYVSSHYKELSKQWASEWKLAVQDLQNQVETNGPMSVVASSIAGATHNVTMKFTPVSPSIVNVQGVSIGAPLTIDPNLFAAILNTPLNEVSELVYTKDSKDWAFIIRPLQRDFIQLDEIPEANPITQQALVNYKTAQISTMFGDSLAERYNVRIFPEVLTNFQTGIN